MQIYAGLQDTLVLTFILTFYFNRIILTAVLIVQKFFNDSFFNNHYLAMLGGVQLEELNSMEQYFLEILDYKVFVKPETF